MKLPDRHSKTMVSHFSATEMVHTPLTYRLTKNSHNQQINGGSQALAA
jgi:hypothetical protein